MTAEEAIKRFETLLLHVDTDCVMGMETTEAINMAIKALEQPEIIRCKDCRWYKKERGWNGIEYTVCKLSTINRPIREEDDFCSRAERRTDE